MATGLILEFEFGTNWSNYSWFVGDIFGAPLAIEGILNILDGTGGIIGDCHYRSCSDSIRKNVYQCMAQL